MAIQQYKRSSWHYNDNQLAQYDVFVHNTGTADLSNITLKSSLPFESVWAVDSADGMWNSIALWGVLIIIFTGSSFSLPYWRHFAGGVKPSQFHQFGCILPAFYIVILVVIAHCLQSPN